MASTGLVAVHKSMIASLYSTGSIPNATLQCCPDSTNLYPHVTHRPNENRHSIQLLSVRKLPHLSRIKAYFAAKSSAFKLRCKGSFNRFREHGRSMISLPSPLQYRSANGDRLGCGPATQQCTAESPRR